MRRFFTITTLILCVISIVLGVSGCKNIARQPPMNEKFDYDNYEVTFFDDFDGDSLDTKHWRYFTGQRHNANPNRHIHRGGYYSSEDDIVFVKDGALTIRTKYKDGIYGKGWYSAWVETSFGDKIRGFEPSPSDYVGLNQKYGYFEVRCIAPPAEGMWSAFWLMPDEGKALTSEDTQGTAEDGAEIDVMESQNYFRKKPYVQHVVHSDYGTGNGPKSDKSPIYIVDNMYSEFHTYGVEWTEDLITFYIDGYKTYSTANVVDGKTLGTPKVKESLILSVEVAGYSDKDGTIHTGIDKDTGKESWLGTINNMDKSDSYDFVVDYVKVMRKK